MKRILIVLAALLALAGAREASAQGYVVVVNAANPASSLSKAEVSNIFLKKSARLTAVDLPKTSPVRDAFSRVVHGRPAAAVASYWQQQIFAGKDVPPAEKASDAEVLSWVRANANGIGYVAAGTALGAGVKAVTVQ
jgi:ABC-type phosphate transport system substrate-binding protein